MRYELTYIPIVNPCFDSKNISKGRVVSVVDGEIKVINCSPSAFTKIIECIDGKKNFGEIEEELREVFPLDGIRNYLDVMLSEKIIIIPKLNDCVHEKLNVMLIGSGRLLNALEKNLCVMDSISFTVVPDLGEVENALESKKYHMACVAPESAVYNDMLCLNKVLLNYDLPYILYYYNGAELVAGPFIIPGKTACYECQVRHRMQSVNEKLDFSKRIEIDDLRPVTNIYRISEAFSDEQILFVGKMVCKDIDRFANKEGKYDFFESEKRFCSESAKLCSDSVYHVTTACESCCGMKQNIYVWDKNKPILPPDYSDIDEEPIKYTVGGFRSLSEEETKKYILTAFESTGMDISIQRMRHSPFDNILPIYRAFLKSRHNAKTKYHFRDAVTHGKGMTETQSFLSASFELAEHISAYYLGDIDIIQAPYSMVQDQAIDMQPIAESIYNHATAFDDFSPDNLMDWVWAKSLKNGEYKLVPASMVFAGDVKLCGQFINPSSSGLAAGATLKDAILQGMYEVIEHDAWMIGQGNSMPLPQIDYMTSANENLKKSVNAVKAMGYKVIFRDYSNDLGFPVFRCWIVNPDNFTHYATSGFGASLSPEISLERAFTEAVQSADVLTDCDKTYFGRANAKQLMMSADSYYSLAYFQKKDILGKAKTRVMQNYTNKPVQSVKQAINDTVSRITANLPESDILYVDLTKSSLNVPVVRVIITGDIQRLNIPMISISQRMYDFPVNMGYSHNKSSIKELYLGQYPH